jgi:hypothetical protein
MYNGTNILIGAVQPELELEVVGLVVGAAVAGLEVGAAVAGLVVAAAVALVVAATVGLEVAEGLVVAELVGDTVEAVVGLAVAGREVGAEEGVVVAELPEYVTPVSTTPTEAEAMMLLMVT